MSDVQLDNVLDDGSPSLGYINNRYALEVKVRDTEDPTKLVTKRIHLLIDWGDLENIPNILYYELSLRGGFPSTGRADTLYIATDEDMIYRFDVGSGQYKNIGGGGSGGSGSGSVSDVGDDDVVILTLEEGGRKIVASHAKMGANTTVGINEDLTITGEGEFNIPNIVIDEYGHTTTASQKKIKITMPDTSEMITGSGIGNRIAIFDKDNVRKIVGSKISIVEVEHGGESNIPAVYYEIADKAILGTPTLQWSAAYVKEIYENGISLKNKYSSGTHKHTFTPEGTINALTFTGTKVSGSVSYKPAGTVSKPTFAGKAGNATGAYTPSGSVSKPIIEVTETKATVNSITSVGTLPNLATTYDANTQTLAFGWSAGTLPEKGADVNVVTAVSAESSTPAFTGAEANLSLNYTPEGDVSQPTFDGAEATITIDVTAEGTIDQPIFTGKEGTTSTPIA